MPKINYKKILEKKGWDEREVNEAHQALTNEREHDAHFSKIVFYSALLIIIFANVLVSLALLFLSIALTPAALFAVVVLLGLTIGFLYNFLITDIGHLEKKHHILALIIIPLVALINLATITVVANVFISDLKINNSTHNPWLLGIVFALVLVLPSIVEKIFFKKQ